MVFKKKAKKAPETFHFSQEEVSQEGRFGTMRLAEDMRALTQEIASSFDARVARVAGLRQEMKNVQHDLKRMAADLRRFLSNAAASRMQDFNAIHGRIRVRQEERDREVAGMLGGFRRESGAAASHWLSMAVAMARRRASAVR